jgi:outer membrane usher protein
MSMRGPSFALRAQWATPAFSQLGQLPGAPALARRLSASAGMPSGWGGSLSAGFVSTVARDRAPVEVATLGYSQSLGRSAALLLNGARSFSGDGATTVSLTLVIGLGNGMSAAGSVMRQDGGTVSQLQVQRNLQSGDDTGFRALVGDGPTGQRAEAGVIRQSSIGAFSAEAASMSGLTSVRAGATGGLTLLAGRPVLSRKRGEGFGVVHVPDFPGVAVYVNNRLATRTDSRGYAILTDLLPYQANPVRIETSDLPIDTAIDTTQMQAVPHFRSAVMLRFPIRRSASALVRLVLDDGEPIPLGAEVLLEGVAEPFIVANDGEVYLTGLSTQNRLSATWEGQRCTFDVNPGERLGQLPRIGPVGCAGIRR